MDFSVINFEKSYLQPVLELFRASILQGAAAYYTPAELEAWAATTLTPAQWQARLAEQQTLLAVQGNLLLGFASRRGPLVDLLYTHPEHLRRGVARGLYLALEQAALTGGHTELETHASRASRPFFEQQGWQMQAIQQVCRGTATLENYLMKKVLA